MKEESQMKVENCFLALPVAGLSALSFAASLRCAAKGYRFQSLTQHPELFIHPEFLVTPQTRSPKKEKARPVNAPLIKHLILSHK